MQYTEKSPKTWSSACIAIYLVGIGYMAIDTIPEEFGLWLSLSALFLLVLLPCLAVPLSKSIFNRIHIDSQTLRVGRERFALTDIDPASVLAATHAGMPTSPQANARLVGGGWAVPMGMASAVITTHQGEHLTICGRPGFLRLIGRWLFGFYWMAVFVPVHMATDSDVEQQDAAGLRIVRRRN